MRRFLPHVLPGSFTRIRHNRLLADGNRRHNLATVRRLLAPPIGTASEAAANIEQATAPPIYVCRHCGKPVLIVRLLEPDLAVRAPPRRIAACLSRFERWRAREMDCKRPLHGGMAQPRQTACGRVGMKSRPDSSP